MLPSLLSTQLGTAWSGLNQVGNRQDIVPAPFVLVIGASNLIYVKLPEVRQGRK